MDASYTGFVLSVLVHPPQRIDPRNVASGIVIPPLWLGGLAALLRQQGHTVAIVDATGEGLGQKFHHGLGTFRGLTFEEISGRIPPQTAVIGLSGMFSSSWPMVRGLLHHLKKSHPQALLVLGGEHASALPTEVMAETPADLLVTGEGEATATEVWAHLREADAGGQNLRGLSWQGVLGVVWRNTQGEVMQEDRRPRLRSLDHLPSPDWAGIPVADYLRLGKGHGAFQGAFMPLLATRGCPYRCTFCASASMWTPLWVPRDPARVVDEMEDYHRRFGATDFHFVDMTFVLKKDWAEKFCEEIEKRHLKITWQLPGGTRTEAITQDLARRMAHSGLTHMAFAVESGDEATLEKSRKRLNLQKQRAAARAARRAGIHLFGFFIIGFPYETPRSLWRTWVQILRAALLGYHEINITAFGPLPGTEDFNTLRQQGKITLDDAFYTGLFNLASLGKQKSYSPVLSDGALRHAITFGLLSFFMLSWTLRPWRFLREAAEALRGSRSRAKLVRFVRSVREMQQLEHRHA